MDAVWMSALGEMFGVSHPTAPPLKTAFMRWQCRVRQIAMREKGGRPDDGVMPELTLAGGSAPLGHIITIMSKSSAFSKVPEMMHIVRKTNDPAQRQEQALKFLSEYYYQNADEFSDTLTATFPARSEGAAQILAAEHVDLTYRAFGHGYRVRCSALQLQPHQHLFRATWWHNSMFNPVLDPETIFIGFEPNWRESEETG